MDVGLYVLSQNFEFLWYSIRSEPAEQKECFRRRLHFCEIIGIFNQVDACAIAVFIQILKKLRLIDMQICNKDCKVP